LPAKKISSFPQATGKVTIRFLGIPGKFSPLMDTQIFVTGNLVELIKLEDIKNIFSCDEKNNPGLLKNDIYLKFKEGCLKGRYPSIKYFRFSPVHALFVSASDNIKKELFL
jgi:hypothetical protein